MDSKSKTKTQPAKDGAKDGKWMRIWSQFDQERVQYATLGEFLCGLGFAVALLKCSPSR
jgi:hypothetical protein